MATRFPVSSVAHDVVSLRQVMDRVLSDSLAPSRTRTVWSSDKSHRAQAPIALDVYTTEDRATVLAAIPGVDPEQIDITIDKNTLSLKGEFANSAQAEDATGATWYLHELPWGSFQRSLTLPWEIDVEVAEATFDHGLLRLTLPKAQSARPRQIRVRVEGSQPAAIETDATPESTDA